MKTRRRGLLLGAVACLLLAPLLGQRRSRFRGEEYEPPPPDANEETEYYFVRLAYGSGGRSRRGWGGGSWATDAPKAERQFLQGVRRLTSLHARSMEKFIQPLDKELFDHPWIYAVEVGYWYLDDAEAAQMREYLLRGGFLMVDDFHGSWEWQSFMESMQRVFSDWPVVDIDSTDPVFHMLYDLGDDVMKKVQVPGISPWYGAGVTYERDGVTPRWRGIYDDKGRLMVVINHNMDLGDAWEWADDPNYPEHWTALAYRFGINYIIYAMTH